MNAFREPFRRKILSLILACAASPMAFAEMDWHETVAVAKSILDGTGQNIEQASLILRRSIKAEAAIDVDCAAGWWSGISDAACLLGRRHVARALSARLLPKLDSATAEVLAVRVAGASGLSYSPDHIYVDLAFTLSAKDMASVLNAVLSGPEMRHRASLWRAFLQSQEELEAQLVTPFRFAKDLTLNERWSAVQKLLAAFAAEPTLLPRPSEALYIGRRERDLHEQHQQLQEDLDISCDDYGAFLRRPPPADVVARVQRWRQNIEHAHEDLLRRSGWDADCNAHGDLTLAQCLSTLQKLAQSLELTPQKTPRAGRVMIAGLSDLPQMVLQYAVAGTAVWAVRADAPVAQLNLFAQAKGWLGPTHWRD